MSDRPTPETDAAYKYWPSENAELVDADFARNLERERDEAREALRTLAEHGENEIQKLIKECDEARNKMADALQEVDLRTLDYERMKQERDEAREVLENHTTATIHTCHSECKRPMCVLRRERDEARGALARITEAARAVVDRWEQPSWKDTEPTAAVIYRLRDALGREAE